MNHGRKTGYALALAASLALPGAAALAGGHPDRSKFDTNGDGSVDLAEMQAAHPDFTVEKFNAADANHDGQLRRDELRGTHHRGERFSKLDADADGSLTLAEMQKARPELTQDEFTAHDADRDGKVSKDELKKSFGREMFGRLDKDASGGISLAEMQAVRSSTTEEKFAGLDTDGNGQLSHEELRAGHHKRN